MDYGYLFASEPAGFVTGVTNFLQLRPLTTRITKKKHS
jgi:hypothetical protein